MKRNFTLFVCFFLIIPFFLVGQTNSDDDDPAPCPKVIAPVCGINGVTYLNSCYAERDGITEYTEGVCYSDCISPDKIDLDAICDTDYDPVCGCNGVSYINACIAENSGVTKFTPGLCPEKQTCYDPLYMITSSKVIVTYHTGVITPNCPADSEPVCGCDGITYQNPCAAETSGITSYTYGPCSDQCIDPASMNADQFCEQLYEPVCGCNDVTYVNACEAEKAGVRSFTDGPCGNLAAWCEKAIPIQCGDFLSGETNAQSTNNIDQYNCGSSTFEAPEQVYVIHKATVGDLQIGLEIITENIDLDIFLLDGNCNRINCLYASKSDNSRSNNEGIIYEDAPIGTYYIVVDGQYETAIGSYNLEVSCGYLQCQDAISLECGVPYQGNNLNGGDNVSLYKSGQVLNVENNGPEIVHTFTVTEQSPVTIELKDLTANLELFLLSTCDQNSCIKYSQNPGTQSEIIQALVEPGTYYVVVDGYNGAVGDYTLQVDCAPAAICDLTYASLTASPSACDRNSGRIVIESSGGDPGYIVKWAGPISGSFSTHSNRCTIYNLPAGNYTVTKLDQNGCSITEEVTIESGGGLAVGAQPKHVSCGYDGAIQMVLSNGVKPYQFSIQGPVSKNFSTNSTFFNISNLPIGTYDIYIVDKLGCAQSATVEILQGDQSFDFIAGPEPAICEQLGAIKVDPIGGNPPYKFKLAGPVSGQNVVNASKFRIIKLPGGTYQLTVEDASGCMATQVVVVKDEEMDMTAQLTNGLCGNNGSIVLSMTNGEVPYKVSWAGPTNGERTIHQSIFQLSDLPSGTYQITVMDNNWCSDLQVVTVTNENTGLDANVISVNSVCGQPGSIWIDVLNSHPPFEVSWSGIESGSKIVTATGFDIEPLPPGSYTVKIEDAGGCEYQETIEIVIDNTLSADIRATNADCGGNGALAIEIENGKPDYIVTWTGPVDGSLTSSEDNFDILSLPPGDYSVTITDANGCTLQNTTTIEEDDSGLTIATLVTNGICADKGSILLEIQGGSPSYTVIWSGPFSGSANDVSTDFLINDLETGSYQITVKDALACATSKTIEIVNTETIPIEVQVINGLCGEMGAATILVDGPTDGSFTLSWQGPVSGEIPVNEDLLTLQDLPTGVYDIVLENASGCVTETSLSVTNLSGLQNVNVTVTQPVCEESTGSATLSIDGGSAPYNISWIGPVSDTIVSDTPEYTATNLPKGDYQFVVKDDNNCTIHANIAIEEEVSTLVVELNSINGVCGGNGAIQLIMDGGVPGYKIEIQGPIQRTSFTNFDATNIAGLVAGDYTIEVRDNRGCTYNDVFSIDSETGVTGLVVTPEPGGCNLDGGIALQYTGGIAPYQIEWKGPSDGLATTDEQNYEVIGLGDGNYDFTVTDADGCAVFGDASIDNNFTFSIVAKNAGCSGPGEATFNIVGGTAPYLLEWKGNQNGNTTIEQQQYTLEDLAPGEYAFTITDQWGCKSVNSIVISLQDALAFEVTPTPVICDQSGLLLVNVLGGGTPPYEVAWTGPKNGTFTFSGGLKAIPHLPEGSYTVQVEDAENCVYSKEVTIVDQSSDLTVNAATVVNDCGQYNNIWIDILGGSGPFQLSWKGPEEGSETIVEAGFEIEHLEPGTYEIWVADQQGCIVQAEVVIVPTLIDLFSVVGVDGECGETASIEITISDENGPYEVSWTGTHSGQLTTNDRFFKLKDLAAGTYRITLANGNWCTETEEVTVEEHPTEVKISTAIIANDCGQYNNIWLDIIDGIGPYTVAWDGPVDGQTGTEVPALEIEHLLPGTYTVTVVDQSGCAVYNQVNIQFTDIDLLRLEAKNGQNCEEGQTITITVNDGLPPYQLTWSGPVDGEKTFSSNTLDLADLPDGTYHFSLMDENWCMDNASVAIQRPVSDLSLETAVIVNHCDIYNTIWIDVFDGEGPLVISWSGPVSGTETTTQNGYEIEDLPPGDYEVSVQDNTGCIQSKKVTIYSSENDWLQLTTSSGANGQTTSIQIDISGGSPNYSIEWIGTVNGNATISGDQYLIEDLPGGTYQVSLTDANGCTSQSSITLTGSLCDFSASINPVDGTCSTPAAIWLELVGGQGPFEVKWEGTTNGTLTTNDFNLDIKELDTGTYSVSIVDVNGCSVTKTVNVQNNTSNEGGPSFAWDLNGFTITTTNTSPEGNYQWSFGDGGTSTERNPVYAFCEEGTFEVCLTTDNLCGQTQTCQSVVVAAPDGIVLLDVGEISGVKGSNVYLPVKVKNLPIIVSLAGTINVFDPSVGQITGLSPGAIAPQYNANDQTFNFYDNTGNGITLQDDDVLFYMVVKLTGSPGEETLVRLEEQPLRVEVGTLVNGLPGTVPYLLLKGKITISAMGQISGNIETYWGEGIELANVQLMKSNEVINQEYTIDNGYYMLPDVTLGDTVMVKPALDLDHDNGLSTFGLFIGQRYILGMKPPQITSPYQVIAGDANCNGAFTTLDLFLIQQLIIRNTDRFRDCPSWVFVSSKNEMPDPFNAYNVFPYQDIDVVEIKSEMVSDFTGVKVGDILGHAIPNSVASAPIIPRENRQLTLQIEETPVTNGQVIDVPLMAIKGHDLASFQFGLSFDPEKLSFVGLADNQESFAKGVQLGVSGIEDGQLRVSWYDGGGQSRQLAVNQPLMSLRFKVKNPTYRWSDVLSLSSRIMTPVAHDEYGEAQSITLQFNSSTSSYHNYLGQNRPNPFLNQTVIPFGISQSGIVELIIHDHLGQLLYQRKTHFESGHNQFTVDAANWPAGVYYYTVKSATFMATKSLIAQE